MSTKQRAWDTAKSPMQGMIMMGVMMWLSGSSVQIFSIMAVGYALFSPLKAIYSTGQGTPCPRALTAVPCVLV